ncbi:MAG: transcription-repair coupling factor [Planctomycetota bacterium]
MNNPLAAESLPLQQRVFAASPVLRELATRVQRGGVITVGRAGDAAGALAIAFLAEQLQRPVLVLTAGLDEAERARRDVATFLDRGVDDFPPWESLFEDSSEPDPDTFARRTAAVETLRSERAATIVAPVQAVLQPVARTRSGGPDRRFVLRPGDVSPPGELARALVEAGYRRFPQVARAGDFSIRGGIFDIYPREGAHPYRLEYFGDEIDSIRAVSPENQRSGNEVSLLVLTLLPKDEYFLRGFTGREVTLFDELPTHTLLVLFAPREVEQKCVSLIGQWAPRTAEKVAAELWARCGKLTRIELETLPPEAGRGPLNLPVRSAERFRGSLERVCEALASEAAVGKPVRIYFRQEAEIERFQEILTEANVGATCTPEFGDLSHGFEWDEPAGGIFLAGGEILGRSRTMARRARQQKRSEAVATFLELEPGDYVVHLTHGLARYKGIQQLDGGRRQGDHLILEFRDGVTVLVPAERIDLVQKYVGTRKAVPLLDKVGGTNWARRKQKVIDALHDLASEMLELQALRAERAGFSFPEDNHYQNEFEAAFPFQETRDQLETMVAIKKDMQSPKPMDRLVCGDVGYGKTELAMRAAFKVVQAGKQVAVLVPTTVLAQQHLLTFRERMAEFPVRVDAISRFRTRGEATGILKQAQEGKLDILIGTHRLLSNDVSFADIGLIIIDEEQRFGVVHKEKLKQLRRLVDVLTLTATPIPRTLHMALTGVRDISSLSEPPEGRRAVRTEVCPFEPRRFREIALRELNRDGQIFWVHNRVHSIRNRELDLQQLLPEARIVHVHGQMDEHELERRMTGFLHKEFDVLLTTTIIESGLDIPSANTLIVDRADRFGLAELHQLRGRVGRGQHQAYAYFLTPDERPVNPEAAARLQAIEEFSSLGSGFQIAMRDLEIRGAGNILGREQSGHIATIGYDLYCRLLERAVAELKGVTYSEPPDVEIAIPGSARIPEEYITQDTLRLRAYRGVATALDADEVADLESDLVDRYGEIPVETRSLLQLQLLRIYLGRCGCRKVWLEDGWLVTEGHARSVEKEFRARGWQVVHLPDGEVCVRPSAQTRLESLAQVVTTVLGT